MMKNLSLIMGIVFSVNVLAADDPSIKGNLRLEVKTAMGEHISQNTIGSHFVIYDSVKGHLKKLSFKKLHDGVVKKGDFYVSCADFVDASGKLYDLDFLVAKTQNGFRVLQPLVHAVNGKKRPYHVEG